MIGEIYEDKDKRREGRRVIVLGTDGFHAEVRKLDTNGVAIGPRLHIMEERLRDPRHYQLISPLEQTNAQA